MTSNVVLTVWKVRWPNGIGPEEYVEALRYALTLAEELGQSRETPVAKPIRAPVPETQKPVAPSSEGRGYVKISILAQLQQGPKTHKQLAEVIDCAPNAVRMAMRRMAGKEILPAGGGKWKLRQRRQSARSAKAMA